MPSGAAYVQYAYGGLGSALVATSDPDATCVRTQRPRLSRSMQGRVMRTWLLCVAPHLTVAVADAAAARARPFALCISGQLRALVFREVQDNIRAALIEPLNGGVDSFAAIQLGSSKGGDAVVLRSGMRVALHRIGVRASTEYTMLGIPSRPCNYPSTSAMSQAVGNLACARLMYDEESRRGSRYQFVIRARPDQLHVRRLPPPADFFQSALASATGPMVVPTFVRPQSWTEAGLPCADDAMALMNRAAVEAYYDGVDAAWKTCSFGPLAAATPTCFLGSALRNFGVTLRLAPDGEGYDFDLLKSSHLRNTELLAAQLRQHALHPSTAMCAQLRDGTDPLTRQAENAAPDLGRSIAERYAACAPHLPSGINCSAVGHLDPFDARARHCAALRLSSSGFAVGAEPPRAPSLSVVDRLWNLIGGGAQRSGEHATSQSPVSLAALLPAARGNAGGHEATKLHAEHCCVVACESFVANDEHEHCLRQQAHYFHKEVASAKVGVFTSLPPSSRPPLCTLYNVSAASHGKRSLLSLGHVLSKATDRPHTGARTRAACTLPFNRPNPAWPINSVDPPERVGNCREEVDACPSIFLPLSRIWEEMHAATPSKMSHFVLNIGARDGKAGDPLYVLLTKRPTMAGLAIEVANDVWGALNANLAPFRNMRTSKRGIFANDAIDACKVHVKASPQTMDILKLDIDSCECHLLSVLLADPTGYFRAKIIHIELNHNIPPPFAYKDMCAQNKHGRSSDWYLNPTLWGCSMQAAYDVVRPYGYKLLQYDWPDAVFILDEHRDAFPCLPTGPGDFLRNYWIGYYHARDKYARFKGSFLWAEQIAGPVARQYPGAHSLEVLRAPRNATPALEWAFNLPETTAAATLDPTGFLTSIIERFHHTWVKKPLHIEMGVAGTNVSVSVYSLHKHPTLEQLNIVWHSQ